MDLIGAAEGSTVPKKLIRSPTPGEIIAAFVLGSLIGSTLDMTHTHVNVLGYNTSDVIFLRMAWWVLPEFGAAGLACLFSPFFFGLRKVALSQPATLRAQCVIAVCVYAGSSLLALLGASDETISMALGLIVAMTYLATDCTLRGLVLCMFAGAAGISFEHTLCAIGMFHYNAPDFGNVRHWICWIWMAVALAGHGLASALLRVEARKAKTK